MFISLLLPNKDTPRSFGLAGTVTHNKNQMKRTLRIHGLYSEAVFNLFFKSQHGKVDSVQNQEECQASMRSKTI